MVDVARARKLAVRIREVVATTLELQVKDPRLGMVTITDAKVTPDLREATLYYTVFGDDRVAQRERRGARERQGRPAHAGGPADRCALHAVAGLHRRRRARDHRPARGAARAGPARGRPRPGDRVGGAARGRGRPVPRARVSWSTTRTTTRRRVDDGRRLAVSVARAGVAAAPPRCCGRPTRSCSSATSPPTATRSAACSRLGAALRAPGHPGRGLVGQRALRGARPATASCPRSTCSSPPATCRPRPRCSSPSTAAALDRLGTLADRVDGRRRRARRRPPHQQHRVRQRPPGRPRRGGHRGRRRRAARPAGPAAHPGGRRAAVHRPGHRHRLVQARRRPRRQVHELAARLLATGIRHDLINRAIWDTQPFGYVQLLGEVCARARLEPRRRGRAGPGLDRGRRRRPATGTASGWPTSRASSTCCAPRSRPRSPLVVEVRPRRRAVEGVDAVQGRRRRRRGLHRARRRRPPLRRRLHLARPTWRHASTTCARRPGRAPAPGAVSRAPPAPGRPARRRQARRLDQPRRRRAAAGGWPAPARSATPARSTRWPPACSCSASAGPPACSGTSRSPTRRTTPTVPARRQHGHRRRRGRGRRGARRRPASPTRRWPPPSPRSPARSTRCRRRCRRSRSTASGPTPGCARGRASSWPPAAWSCRRLDVVARRGDDVDVVTEVSSGTYVRALARDVGAALGVGAHLTALRRTRVGPFGLDRARPLEALTSDEVVDAAVVRLDDAVAAAFPARALTPEEAVELSHGRRLVAARPSPAWSARSPPTAAASRWWRTATAPPARWWSSPRPDPRHVPGPVV